MDIHLDRDLPIGLGDQLRSQIRALVDAGMLGTGDLLPSARRLAREQGVNVNTVAAAYASLESEGYLVQRKRAGTRVSAAPPRSTRTAFLAALGADAASKARALTIGANELVSAVAAHAVLGEASPRFRVALLVDDPLQAEEALTRGRMLFRHDVALIAVTPEAYDSASVHFTAIHPALTERLVAPTPAPQHQLEFDADFPAPAD